MIETLNNFVANLKFGEPIVHDDLIITPILADTDYSVPFLGLEEALARNAIEITEKDEAGSVPELLVNNKSEFDVIIFEGEQLIGAKQNRILNTTVIVPAGSTIVMPVSCVEEGRWSYRTKGFFSAKYSAYPEPSSKDSISGKKKPATPGPSAI